MVGKHRGGLGGMTARILVVDDVAANVKLLEARLSAEYYDVVTARSGPEAIEICEDGKIDLVLLDIMMPGMDGFEVCRILKGNPKTEHVPVVMVTALDQTEHRVMGLEAGADDFLVKPVNDVQLLTRVRTLTRLKALTDELRLRAETTNDMDIAELLHARSSGTQDSPPILLVDANQPSRDAVLGMLSSEFVVDTAVEAQDALLRAIEGGYECILIATGSSEFDPLRLCAQLHALERTRSIPIILIASPGEERYVLRGLELAAHDYVLRPVVQMELIARIRTQIRRKSYNDRLRSSVARTVEMAITDPLTGVYNRRYLDSHLQSQFHRAQARKRPLSLMIIDVDRFKWINDQLGHAAGDQVLQELALRLQRNLRGKDLICRFGGEEFIVVMPDTELADAFKVGERIRGQIADRPFSLDGGKILQVTASVGISGVKPFEDSPEEMLKRADVALYKAKAQGRNRVVAPAA